MALTVAMSLSKWALDAMTKLVKASVRVHHPENIPQRAGIIFAVNHFTRLETILLPYFLFKHTGRPMMSLAAAELFTGPVGQFLRQAGAVSTEAPDRDHQIVRALLTGQTHWIIFPEGAMIKDKKVVGETGDFEVYSQSGRRPPHTGAASLALRSEFYRHKIECIHERPHREGLAEALDFFNLQDAGEVLNRHTVIVPVNITYFPIRAHENIFLRLAQRITDDLSPRAIEELSVEGTVLSEDTDIDITLGGPIDARSYLLRREYASVMECGIRDLHLLEEGDSPFNAAATALMRRHMRAIYELTTVNHDHLFATLLRHQRQQAWTPREYRLRLFWCARQLHAQGLRPMHSLLARFHAELAFGETFARFDDFLRLAVREGLLQPEASRNETAYRYVPPQHESAGFHDVRRQELVRVIANEIEPLHDVAKIVARAARMPCSLLERKVRDTFQQEDQARFEKEYEQCFDPEFSKDPVAGQPFLLKPWRIRGGVVLAHGYMAAPLEVRAMAEYFQKRGFVVYGVRFPGHGTSPASLAASTWEEWYEAFNRGYAIVRSFTKDIALGGFSTGGCLALIAAARKVEPVRAVFSICAPWKLKNPKAVFAPPVATLSALLKRVGAPVNQWDYVPNYPENPHINYTKNPLAGVKQLVRAIDVMEEALPKVTVPALVLQASKDHVVNPESGRAIFDRIGSEVKELVVLERDHHGIINDARSDEVFEHIHRFVQRAERLHPPAGGTYNLG